MQASKISFSDGKLLDWAELTQTRNGVVIDRDSETAVDNLLYSYEVTPEGIKYEFKIELTNPTDKELGLMEIGLSEWEQGVLIGGFTSRGLGRAKLRKIDISRLDFSDEEKRRSYLEKLMDGDNSMESFSREDFKDFLAA